TGLVAVPAVSLVAVALGEGVHTLTLGFFGLMICLVSVLTHLRAGLLLTGLCALAVMALAAAEALGMLPGAAAVARQPLELRVVTQLMLLAAGLVAGTLMSRVIGRWLSALEERERRFSGLLRIAVDSYWEMDAQYHFTVLADQRRGARTAGAGRHRRALSRAVRPHAVAAGTAPRRPRARREPGRGGPARLSRPAVAARPGPADALRPGVGAQPRRAAHHRSGEPGHRRRAADAGVPDAHAAGPAHRRARRRRARRGRWRPGQPVALQR